jgi:hypothetical protein
MACTGKTGKSTNNMYEQRPGNFSSTKKLPYKSISIKIHIPTEIVYSTRLLIDPLNYFFLNRVTNNPNAGPIATPIPAPIATLPKAAPIPAPRATPIQAPNDKPCLVAAESFLHFSDFVCSSVIKFSSLGSPK